MVTPARPEFSAGTEKNKKYFAKNFFPPGPPASPPAFPLGFLPP
jgi:hypothetical protein